MPEVKTEVLQRISRLDPTAKNHWGKMNVRQMLRHCQEGLQISYGDIRPSPKKNWMVQQLMRWFIFHTDIPTPKAKAITFPEIDQVLRNSDPPDFENEKRRLTEMLQQYPARKMQASSPLLGRMSEQNWARLNYTHLDHHLRQFGV